MSKESQYLPENLFVEDPAEKDLEPGYIPERWMRIEEAQLAVWQSALEKQISKRQQNVKRPFYCTRFLNSWRGILQVAF